MDSFITLTCQLVVTLLSMKKFKKEEKNLLRDHNWVLFPIGHNTVTLNLNYTILKTYNCFQLDLKKYIWAYCSTGKKVTGFCSFLSISLRYRFLKKAKWFDGKNAKLARGIYIYLKINEVETKFGGAVDNRNYMCHIFRRILRLKL